jgi:hypothetical protein
MQKIYFLVKLKKKHRFLRTKNDILFCVSYENNIPARWNITPPPPRAMLLVPY